VIKDEMLEVCKSFDSEMPNLPLPLDSLTQSKKKDQAILFCPIKHGFNTCATSFKIVY
jgi:hypothetical protein